MNEDELKNKLREWGLDDRELTRKLAYFFSEYKRAAERNLPLSENFDNDVFILAKYARKIPRRKSLRIIIEEMSLLVLAQLEPNGIPSMAINRYRLLMSLILSQPFKDGPGIIEAKEAEIRSVCDSIMEDLRGKGQIKVESGALCLTESGARYSTHLLECLDFVQHKVLDELTDRIDFWIIAVVEREREIEKFLGRNRPASYESLTRFFPEDEESLYEKLESEVWDLVREYRQRIPPHKPDIPPMLARGQLGSTARIESDIKSLALYSEPVGEGITRLALSRHETDALLWAKEKLAEAGYECNIDAFMNLHAYDRRRGNCRILVGTHLDSVQNGGKYDGVVGLVTFLESLRLASEENRSFPLPVDVVIFRAEESTVFKVALLGSRVATGKFNAKDLQNIRIDRDQELKENLALYYPNVDLENLKPITLFDVLSRYSDAFPAEIIRGCWFFDYSKESYVCYVEVHIEQGMVLEMERRDFGIVTGFRAPYREVITIIGEANHSGSTPMGAKYRRDAGCAMAECILAIEKIGNEESARGVDVVATNGFQSTPGGAINKIPGKAIFTLDLRSNDLEARKRVLQRIHNVIAEICRKRSVTYNTEERENSEPFSLDKNPQSKALQAKLEKAIGKLGYTCMRIASGAGHDAMTMASVGIPTCMLFIPCEKGVSHSPEEKAEADDIAKASKVLLEFLCDFRMLTKTPADSTLESFTAI